MLMAVRTHAAIIAFLGALNLGFILKSKTITKFLQEIRDENKCNNDCSSGKEYRTNS